MTPGLDPAMAFFGLAGDVDLCRRCVDEVALDLALQRGLIALDRQQIIAAGLGDGACDGGIAGDRVDGDKGAVQRQPRQQRGNGLALAGFVRHRLLTEHEIVRRGESRDEVERRFAARTVMAAARGLAITSR